MKIKKLEINKIRGVVQLILEPDGNNMVVYGPNGTERTRYLMRDMLEGMCASDT